MEKIAAHLTDDFVNSIAALAEASGGKAEFLDASAALPKDAVREKIALLAIRDGNGNVVTQWPDIDKFRGRPVRITGTAQVTTAESFIALVNRHKGKNSAIFLNNDWRKPSITAVIDYHDTDGSSAAAAPVGDDKRARFGNHRVHYAFPLSESWKAWLAQHGKPLTQAEFAAFLEDHIHEISSPTAGESAEYQSKFRMSTAGANEIFDLARGLDINVESAVKSRTKLQSGETQFVFEEIHKDATGADVIVPGLFIIDIPIFYRGESQRILVRLRYRPTSGGITWSYEIYRPDEIVDAAIRLDAEIITTKTELPVFDGAPE